MKKLLLLLFLSLSFISCTVEDLNDKSPCIDGSCDAKFIIDTIQNPGSYQDSQGVWHIKHSGLNYFRIKGKTDQLTSQYISNGVPLIETGFDSNYFILPNNITWTYPVYSFLGLFSNNNLQTAIPYGFFTYTLPQITEGGDVTNIVGYEISKHFNYNHPAAQTMLQTYSKYNYSPQKEMIFFTDMIGDEAKIYIRVIFNSDYGGVSEEKIYELKVKFEN